MSDYIIEVSVDKLKPHPINETIYDTDENQLEDLMKSIEVNGLLEPITIDNDNLVYSGHRRLEAVRRLGWVSVKCRLSSVVHPIITIIESNRQRKKTSSELLREADLLNEQYKQNGFKVRVNDDEKQFNRTTIKYVSDNIGISLTKLKQLKSIQHYQPELLSDIDLGIISVNKAYQIIRKKYILDGDKQTKKKTFEDDMLKVLLKYKPMNGEVMKVLERYYNYV
jgi:ParB family chromosome partitioning protein|tara:strand:+ start:5231 stop:5902 length:672 start_codon:yes stop_codon:yes gene_type:complete